MTGRMIGTKVGRLHVRVDGPAGARPLVLIHGFASSLQRMGRIADLLAENYRVIRVDLLGHGFSETAKDLDAPAQAAAIIEVLDQLGVNDVVAVGHSFGADVAVELVTAGRAAACVVIGQAPDYSYSKLPPALLPQVVPMGLVHRFLPAPFVRLGARSGYAPGFRISAVSDEPNAFVRDYSVFDPKMYEIVLATRGKRLAKRPLDALLRESGVPALAIHGDRDLIWDWRKTIARYRSAGIEVATVDGTGHSPNVERPVTVAGLIRDFIEKH
ncbi:alpha/beta fold hydrolase [Smaragdicoccus niigatensis]|uniref:alpha/beta fold hydrolase n=3 Tax=Smaragdicoccus niigatensis TaxID=359359 RepID=UPI0012DBE4CB|nr:alpha/beta hydrolase [Smaragdicoccus niigatensis]